MFISVVTITKGSSVTFSFGLGPSFWNLHNRAIFSLLPQTKQGAFSWTLWFVLDYFHHYFFGRSTIIFREFLFLGFKECSHSTTPILKWRKEKWKRKSGKETYKTTGVIVPGSFGIPKGLQYVACLQNLLLYSITTSTKHSQVFEVNKFTFIIMLFSYVCKTPSWPLPSSSMQIFIIKDSSEVSFCLWRIDFWNFFQEGGSLSTIAQTLK